MAAVPVGIVTFADVTRVCGLHECGVATVCAQGDSSRRWSRCTARRGLTTPSYCADPWYCDDGWDVDVDPASNRPGRPGGIGPRR